MDMIDKLLGKKQKGIQVFNIPDRKYCHDPKKLSKMDKKDLMDVISDMQKHINNICEKLDLGKKEFERAQQRCEETNEKSKIVNGEMNRINNEHQELQVKFTNLQNSLEMMIQEREELIASQCGYIQQHKLTKQKIKDINRIFQIYQSQINIMEKISSINTQLKEKCRQLEKQYHQLSEKFNQIKISAAHLPEKQQIQQKQNTQEQLTEPSERNKQSCTQCLKYQSMLEGKQQIVTSLYKKIEAEKQKWQQNSDKIQQLNIELEQILKKIAEKDEQLTRMKQQKIQLNNLIQNFKSNETKYKLNQKKMRQECENYKISAEEVNELKQNVQKIEQQKNLIMMEKQKSMRALEELNKSIVYQCQQLKAEIQQKDIQLQNFSQKIKSYQMQINSLSKLSSDIKSKQNQIANMKSQTQQEKNKNEDLKRSIQNLQEQYQIKLKKIQFTSNQQRIKADSLKRSLSNLQVKDEENRKNLDSMYQNKILQDGKIVQMEKKLKQYKHLIQYLKKQKIELERTFQNKIKNMEEMVINKQEEYQQPKQIGQVSSKPPPALSPSPRFCDDEQFQKQIIKNQNRIANLQQQIDMLKQENMSLKTQNEHLKQQNENLERNIKSLNQKREQVMKQIKKMGSIKNTGNQKAPKQSKPSVQDMKGKQKKVAEKAYKGFDILAKLLSSLYKDFINVHLADIQRKQIKQIENNINSIVRKSLDMKDIFQDYI